MKIHSCFGGSLLTIIKKDMKKDDTSKKRKLPTIDLGVDIIGDEWENEEDEEEINTNILQNNEDWENEGGSNGSYNSAQMLNGSFEGDIISQIGKKHQKKEKEETR